MLLQLVTVIGNSAAIVSHGVSEYVNVREKYVLLTYVAWSITLHVFGNTVPRQNILA